MLQTWILALLLPVVPAAAWSAAAANSTPRQTQCGSARLGRELLGDAVPGYPLIAGLRTGMTRAEVKRVAPLLSVMESRQKLELFPGLAFRATARFTRFFGPLDSIELKGNAAQSPVAALTEHFGLPIRIDGGMRVMENPRQTLPAGQNSQFLFGRYSVEKWCDGPRVFILSKDEDTFTLTVAGPRAKR